MSVATEMTGFRTAAQPIACKQGSYALRAETHRKTPTNLRAESKAPRDEPPNKKGLQCAGLSCNGEWLFLRHFGADGGLAGGFFHLREVTQALLRIRVADQARTFLEVEADQALGGVQFIETEPCQL